jgi:hypothetical protein
MAGTTLRVLFFFFFFFLPSLFFRADQSTQRLHRTSRKLLNVQTQLAQARSRVSGPITALAATANSTTG